MSNLKMVFAIVAIVFLGIVVLPYSVSLFAGQHTWYEISGSSDYLPCKKCHADVYEELEFSAFHKNLDGNPDCADDGDCYTCHRANKSITYANASADDGSGQQAHAASCVACMLCHQIGANQASNKPGPFAGGFNVTAFNVDSPHNYSNDSHNGTYEAHNPMVARAISGADNSSILLDSSEACLACHTYINVTIHFNVTTEATIVVNNAYDETPSYWNITGITPSDYTNYTEEK